MLLTAAAAAGKAVVTSSGIDLRSSSERDRERQQRARDDLQAALRGDSAAYTHMLQQSGFVAGYGSATAVGKEAFKQALRDYFAQTGQNPDPDLARYIGYVVTPAGQGPGPFQPNVGGAANNRAAIPLPTDPVGSGEPVRANGSGLNLAQTYGGIPLWAILAVVAFVVMQNRS